MKVPALLLLLCTSLPLSLQSQEANRYGWGPGEIGECVDKNLLPTSPARDLSWSTYFVAGNSLYQRIGRRGEACYIKIADFTFRVEGIDVRNHYQNAFAVLWSEDGAKLYDLENERLLPYVPSGFLSSFLAFPVVSGHAESGLRGCGGGEETEAELMTTTDETPEPSLLYEHRPTDPEVGRVGAGGGIASAKLRRALEDLNHAPDYLPSFSDFQIGDEDLADYATIVEGACERIREYEEEYGPWQLRRTFYPDCDNRADFLAVASRFDTLSPQLIRSALSTYGESISITLWRSASVTLVNEVGDTLRFSASVEGGSQPYLLPWTVTYGEEQFLTWDVRLARILLALLPESEIDRDRRESGATSLPSYNEKAQTLRVIAGYLGLVEGVE